MGGTSRDRWLATLRPLMLAALLTAAWLAWAAGSANAASNDPNPLGSFGQPAVTLFEGASPAAAAVSGLSNSAPAPAPAPAPALQGVPVRVAAAPLPVSGAAATVADVVDPLVNDTADVVTTAVNRAAPADTDATGTLPTGPVTETVAQTVAQTVTDTVDAVVAVVDSYAPALPSVQLPTVPLPTSPLPTMQLPPVSLPTWHGHLPRPTGHGHVPAVAEPFPVINAEPGALAGTGADASAESASSEPAKDASAAGHALRFPVSPLGFLADTHALDSRAPTVSNAVSRPSAPPGAPDTHMVLRFAAVQGQSGSASTGAGSGGGAADVAGAWNPLHDALGALMPDASQFPSAGPTYDPGSSPD